MFVTFQAQTVRKSLYGGSRNLDITQRTFYKHVMQRDFMFFFVSQLK